MKYLKEGILAFFTLLFVMFGIILGTLILLGLLTLPFYVMTVNLWIGILLFFVIGITGCAIFLRFVEWLLPQH